MTAADWIGVMVAIGAGVVGGIIVRIVLAGIRALDAANLDAGRSPFPHEGRSSVVPALQPEQPVGRRRIRVR